MEKREIYAQVAAVHAECINQGFLTTLGVDFLAFMYEGLDQSRSGILLVAEDDDRVIGFVSGGRGLRETFAWMLARPFRLARCLLPSLVRPSRLRRIFEILRYGNRAAGDNDQLPDEELFSLAVLQDRRGSGVAESLYNRLSKEFVSRGVTEFKIVVGDSLLPATKFYTRMGARPAVHIEVHKGEPSTVFVQNLQV